jgi:hypothetical protein
MLKLSLEETTTNQLDTLLANSYCNTTNPHYSTMETELFGPVMTIFVLRRC